MCNCGSKRDAFSAQQPVSFSNPHAIGLQKQNMWPDVTFKYTGKTALTVKGRITGKNYRFNKPGEIQKIDYRDASAMMMVPVLQKS